MIQKKLFLIVILLFFTLFYNKASAQIVMRHQLAIGFDFNVSYNLNSSNPSGEFFLNPKLEYFIIQNLSIGASYEYLVHIMSSTGGKSLIKNTTFTPFGRVFLWSPCYIKLGSRFNLDYSYKYNLWSSLGHSIKCNEVWRIDCEIKCLKDFSEDVSKPLEMGFQIGVIGLISFKRK